MRHTKTFGICFLAIWMVIVLLLLPGSAQDLPHPKTYMPTKGEIHEHKAKLGDPRPILETLSFKEVLPREVYELVTFDIDEMKDKWAETVGFRAPDVVGKIAPEIKPGKYTYQDKDKYPGLKELMWPDMYERINPGGPPHAGKIPEFELIPTRQYYYNLPIAETTLNNIGKTKMDDQGYPDWGTWEGGYPFPRPSGEFKAQQIIHNLQKSYAEWGGNYAGRDYVSMGFTKDLKNDVDIVEYFFSARLAGRCTMPPYGWFDERAKELGEFKSNIFGFDAPRDSAGTVIATTYFLDLNKMNQALIYIPSFRRVRKMSSTDSQDPILGSDAIYDDLEGFGQKLTPERYPYKYEVLEEREFLVPASTTDGSLYYSSEGLELRNVKFERRPVYVLKLTQLDRNYVYGARIFYIDKEHFLFHFIENYDQKGRLYRTSDAILGWVPEMGMLSSAGAAFLARDHIDLHSSPYSYYSVPARFSRKDLSLKALIKRAK